MKARTTLSGIPAKPAAILLRQAHLTIYTGSHQCIPAGNLTGLSGAMNAADAAKLPSCSGIPRCISTITLLL